MKQEKTAAAESAASRYLAYAQKCNIPVATAMLSKQVDMIKAAGIGETNSYNSTKVASVEEKLVNMIIEKYAATESKETILEMAKVLGNLLDEGEFTEEDLTPENLEILKNMI